MGREAAGDYLEGKVEYHNNAPERGCAVVVSTSGKHEATTVTMFAI